MSVAAATPIRVNATGKFGMSVMSAGSYTFTALGAGTDGVRMSGQTTTAVLGPTTEVAISLRPVWKIDGHIAIEGARAGSNLDLSTLRVRAISTITTLADGTEVTPSGSGVFTLGNIGRSNYNLTVAPITPRIGSAPATEIPPAWKNAYVKSVRLGNEDLGKTVTVVEGTARTVDVIATSPLER